jgi:hypothetical protein
MEYASSVLQLSSAAFQNSEAIPVQYTCDGANSSPPLSWSEGPEGTRTFALIVEDPDAPRGVFTHWVVFDLPANVTHLDEKQPAKRALPNGGKQGMNDFGKLGYGGPCPPSGTHRYFFKLYALDTDVKLGATADKGQLLKAMEGHILGQSQLMGTYTRHK